MLPLLVKVSIWIIVGIAVAALMEPWSKIVHGKVWHRQLWGVHRSHHVVPRQGFETNDLLAMTHAPIAIALILYGCIADPSVHREIAYAIGLGMTAFGILYTVFHEGVCHERLPVAGLRRWTWVENLRKAHMIHHHTDGPPYGLFLGQRELEVFKLSGLSIPAEGRRPEVVEREASRLKQTSQ
ncbi:MAG: beta-carotene hydroxylase [Myxococcota bacterium]